ncbi:DUF4403 family protein [Moheibacter sp.]|uniref:DUF4403 family protein n=1 Tax=Moheibacter sp. TaxID=1965316 RepID=UPI003C7109AD
MNSKIIWLTGLMIAAQITLAQTTEIHTFPKIKSHLTVPISIPVPEINNLINISVTGVLYEDNSYTDNDNDQFKVRVEKSDKIKLTSLKENRFLIEVPLKIWAEQGYGGLGYYVYQDTNFNVVMKFISSVELKSDWTLQTQTKTNGFEWTVKPVLDYGTVKIPVASLIEKTLTEQQAKFTTVIDDKIKESFDLKPYLLAVWNNFSAPINISEEYNTWLKITPETVYMSPLKIYSDYVQATVGLDLYSETFIGQIPLPSPLQVRFPNFILKQNLSSDFNLKTTANVSYDQATALARAQFLGQEFVLTSEKNKVKITDVKVYSEDLYVVIEAETTGEVTGTSYIKGFPVYDREKKKIVLTQIDFKLKTRNLFQKAVTTLFERKIKRTIGEEYGIPLEDLITESKRSLTMSFNKEYYPGIFLNGRVQDFYPSQILLFNRNMTVVMDTNASLQMRVDGLNF